MIPPASSVKPVMRKTLRYVLLVGLFMAMAGIGAYVALTLIIKGEEPVIVPDLVGKDVLYGLEILSDLGLNTRVRGTEYHDRVPKHHVIGQEPEPGATIKRGRDVRIRVSRGPENIVMPNLTGLSLQQSRILLTENGLCHGNISTMRSRRHESGQVIAQDPVAGTMVSRNTCSDLLISQEPDPVAVAMQDLSGLGMETAIRQLEKIRLSVGRIESVVADEISLETVVDQSPPPGFRVTRESRVDLTVNSPDVDPRNASGTRSDQVELFRYRLDPGFLNKRVSVKMNRGQWSSSLFDNYMAPGQEIWLLTPKSGNPTILVYVDGHLAHSRILD